ncbi:MAG: hypothetical protein AAGB29_13115 [Planctomycetota bacterium]
MIDLLQMRGRFAALTAAGVAGMAFVAGPALAQQETEGRGDIMIEGEAETIDPEISAAASRISAVVALDWNTHFVSYGLDVWGVGQDFGEDSTFNPAAEVAIDFDYFTFFFGTWWDVNANARSPIGAQLQEVDIYTGVSSSYENFSIALIYQSWIYGGGNEQIFDISLGYDDSWLWTDIVDGFAINPSATFHHRLASTNIAQGGGDESENGWVAVFGIAPSYTLDFIEDYPISLSMPFNLGVFLTENYHGGDTGLGYTSVGLSASVPLSFISAEYGAWEVHGGLTWYCTDPDIIPGNADQDFLTGSIGMSMSF